MLEIQHLQQKIKEAAEKDPGSLLANQLPHLEVLKKYLGQMEGQTGRFVIFYASAWLQKPNVPSHISWIDSLDMDGFLECVYHAKRKKNLDLIIHSPGGSPEAAEQIVTYLRSKFASIRVIVPMQAMSAATMMALAADEICLARHSTLGPTDPQLFLQTNTGVQVVSAHAIKEEFERAKADAASGSMAAWAPILAQYPPGIFAKCEHTLQLTNSLVTKWLKCFMLKGKRDKENKANKIAEFFAGPHHHTHGRPLMLDDLKPWLRSGLKTSLLEDNQEEQDVVMSCYHAMSHMLGGTAIAKAIVSSSGEGYFRYYNPSPTPT